MTLLLATAVAASWSVPADGSLSEVSQLLSDGDVVELTEDTTGCLDAGRSITLQGDVTLTGDGSCESLLVVNDGETLTVQGLKLRNPAGRVAGVWYSHLVLDGVEVAEAGGELQGGAVYHYVGTLTVVDSSFQNNVGTDGGAIAAVWLSSLSIQSSSFQGNEASGHGGAIFTYAIDGPVDVADSTFVDNRAQNGGAIASHWYHHLNIQDCSLSDNRAESYGGAVTSWYNGDLTVGGSEFRDNLAVALSGGALNVYGGNDREWSVSFEDSSFSGNEAGSNGGGIDVSWMGTVSLSGLRFEANQAGGSGGGVSTYALLDLSISNTAFLSGTAVGRGGGLYSAWTSVESLSNSLFVGNEAALGGGLSRYAGYDVDIVNNTFVDNAGGTWGGAAYLEWSYGRFANNLVMGSSGTGLYVMEAYSLINTDFAHNAWWDNTVAHGGGFSHPGVTDLLVEPMLLSETDWRLQIESPLRDAGDPELMDPDGSASDIGAWGGPGAEDQDLDEDGHPYFSDCDDTDPSENVLLEWYADTDGDGYGGGEPLMACIQPEGTFAVYGDCDDTDPDTHPGAVEHRGDGIDQDCDGLDPEPRDPDRSETLRACQPAVAPTWLGLILLMAARRRS